MDYNPTNKDRDLIKYDVISGIKSLYTNRNLLFSFIARDIEMRYRGTVFGFLWIVAYPLIMLSVYSFVFVGVFNNRLSNDEGISDFIPKLYCGLIVYTLFSEALVRSTVAITTNTAYVKKIVFPLELLPIVYLISSLSNALVSLMILLVFVIISHQSVQLSMLYSPLVMVPLLIFIAGLAWIVAAVGVFFRDISQLVSLAMSVLLFLSPVFYSAALVPVWARKLIYLNPLTYPIEELRAIIILGNLPDLFCLGAYFVGSVIIAILGLQIFQQLRQIFADVI